MDDNQNDAGINLDEATDPEDCWPLSILSNLISIVRLITWYPE